MFLLVTIIVIELENVVKGKDYGEKERKVKVSISLVCISPLQMIPIFLAKHKNMGKWFN